MPIAAYQQIESAPRPRSKLRLYISHSFAAPISGSQASIKRLSPNIAALLGGTMVALDVVEPTDVEDLREETTIMKHAFVSIITALSLFAHMQQAAFGQSARDSLPAAQANRLNEPASDNRAAQTAPRADPAVEKVRRDIEKTGMAQKITVFLKNGDALHGAVSMIDRDEFAIAEVDFQRIFTIQYKDVKKIRSGYGAINLLTGKRARPPKAARIAAHAGLLFLILGLPVIALATTKH